jgi:outer membrane protein assembly factor BamB
MSAVARERIAYIGFGKHVIAFDHMTGQQVWNWESPRKDSVGAVTLLLEQEMLVVSVDGYMWGLDPTTGDERWHNPLKGMGTGIPMMVSNSQLTGGTTAGAAAAAVAAAGAASIAASSAASS